MKRQDFVKAKINYKLTPAETLKTIRELQELSQAELSELTGISQSNISAYENGHRQLGRDTALAFAKALKIHPSILLFPDFDINQIVA